ASTDANPTGESGVESVEAGHRGGLRAAEDADLRTAAGVGAADDLDVAAAVEVGGLDVHAAAERRREGVEGDDRRPVLAAEDRHLRTAAGTSATDDVGVQVLVEVSASHVNAAAEARRECEEGAQQVAVGAAEDRNLRPTARPRADDDVAIGVAVE